MYEVEYGQPESVDQTNQYFVKAKDYFGTLDQKSKSLLSKYPNEGKDNIIKRASKFFTVSNVKLIARVAVLLNRIDVKELDETYKRDYSILKNYFNKEYRNLSNVLNVYMDIVSFP